MKKNIVRINESQLKRIISESVRRALNETSLCYKHAPRKSFEELKRILDYGIENWDETVENPFWYGGDSLIMGVSKTEKGSIIAEMAIAVALDTYGKRLDDRERGRQSVWSMKANNFIEFITPLKDNNSKEVWHGIGLTPGRDSIITLYGEEWSTGLKKLGSRAQSGQLLKDIMDRIEEALREGVN